MGALAAAAARQLARPIRTAPIGTRADRHPRHRGDAARLNAR